MVRTVSVPMLAALLLGAPVVLEAENGRNAFSGIVASIDPGGVLVVDEVGPWRGGEGPGVTTRRTVLLTADTKFNTFIRVNVPDRFGGDFLEVELDADSVTPGDFATVEYVRQRGRLVAVRVTLAESNPGGSRPTP